MGASMARRLRSRSRSDAPISSPSAPLSSAIPIWSDGLRKISRFRPQTETPIIRAGAKDTPTTRRQITKFQLLHDRGARIVVTGYLVLATEDREPFFKLVRPP